MGKGSGYGKVILFNEHFVVHGVPALALPLPALSTIATIDADDEHNGIRLVTEAHSSLTPLARQMLGRALERLPVPRGAWCVNVHSTNPIGHGLGSSASFAVALLRALARAGKHALSLEQVNEHALALEQLVHGNPSGIDNTVITYERPVWFVREAPPEFIARGRGHPPTQVTLLDAAGRLE